eukprot:52601-Alexandrium_andersonii.AAC.1
MYQRNGKVSATRFKSVRQRSYGRFAPWARLDREACIRHWALRQDIKDGGLMRAALGGQR